ncbi:MAG TPA: CoA transferase, partial [Candidatus Acidoferrales bacterium]|nr:CoA transferase [Candidatus Acidoferrales bacterium]
MRDDAAPGPVTPRSAGMGAEDPSGHSAPPLQGIRVVEVGNYMAGPWCAMHLADLGADVVKVENPAGGDMTRQTAPFVDGESANFARLNRGKRSLALDLKAKEGREAFLKLAARSDVVVENMRPGTMQDLGLDYHRLSRQNPGLVYVAASGWGQDGPYAQLPGLDIIAQGMSGLMSITGEPGRDPVKVGVPIADLVCALYGALAAVSALRARERDGKGQLIDVSLFESAVSLAIWEAGKFFTTGEVPRPLGSAHQTSAPYQAVRASDGFFTIGATSPRNWASFCQALGLAELEHDPRFEDNASRHAHLGELMPLIEAVTAARPVGHWISVLQEAGVPCGAIQDYAQVFNDPHLLERGFFQDLPHPTMGVVRQLRSAMRLTGTPARLTRSGPRLGEHSVEVLRELGYA